MNELSLRLISELESLSETNNALHFYTQPYLSSNQVGKLDTHKQLVALGRIAFQQKLLAEGAAIPEIRDRDAHMFREALIHHKLKTVDDFEKHFEEGDVIEIYNAGMTQMFHNLEFHKYCSYDLLTLYTVPFNELYARPNTVTDILMENAVDMLACGYRTEKLIVPYHHLRETQNLRGKLVGIQFKYVTPLLNERDEITALAVTCRATKRDLTLV